jgi:hypothetical protein
VPSPCRRLQIDLLMLGVFFLILKCMKKQKGTLSENDKRMKMKIHGEERYRSRLHDSDFSTAWQYQAGRG